MVSAMVRTPDASAGSKTRVRKCLHTVTVVVALLAMPDGADARRGAAPLSRVAAVEPLSAVPVEALPAVDARARIAADAAEPKGRPLRFAVPVAVDIDPWTKGRFDRLPDGATLWRTRVHAPGATDLNFGFTTFRLPEGASLHVASEDYDYYEGPYTAADNEKHGELWTPMVPGDRAVIEVVIPAGAEDLVELELTHVGTGYRDIMKFGFSGLSRLAGSCNNDVVCPEGDPWRDQIRSVGAYSTGGSAFCTGTMVMDAASSFRNFFLTADHCGMDAGNAPSMVVYWNFESANCGDLSGGSLADNQTGAVWRAGSTPVDMSLLELDDDPDPAYGVYYAGWDRSGVAPSGSVGIHHPRGDEKAISFNTDPLTTVNSCIGTGGVNSHWLVDNWEDGTTEPGSSGSALFDSSSKLLVGFLSGGGASCDQPLESDCYGKFSFAWDGASASERLRDWLDPNATGVTSVAGSDPSPTLSLVSIAAADSCLTAPSNENQVWEPGEEIDLSVTIRSTGSFTGISGTLTSTTPGVTVTNAVAAWPNMVASQSAVQLAPFTVQLAESIECLSSVEFDLTLTSNEGGPFNLSLTQSVGSDLTPAVPLEIPDGTPAGIGSDLVVANNFTLTDVNVRVQLNHSYVGDVYLKLRSPAGTEVVLLDRPGVPASTYGCSDNNMDVTFDDASSFGLEDHCAGTSPWYGGTAAPVGSLAAFNGESAAGTWTLTASDNADADTGTLVDWELLATPAITGTCEVCIVNPGVDLSVTKTDSQDPIDNGNPLVYTIDVTNSGAGAAADVVVTETLPAGVTFVSTSGCAEDPGGVPTCTLGAISGVSSRQYTVTVDVDPGTTGVITNGVVVTQSTTETAPGDESATEETTVVDCGNGVVEAGESCDDGNLLDGDCCDSTCQADPSGTACTDDANGCTDDVCDGAGACTHPNNSAVCDDGVFCNGADTCSGGACDAHAGDPCAAGGECANDCDEVTQSCDLPSGTGCSDDGNACTNDECDGTGTCAHPPNSDICDDGIACTVDTCSAGVCSGDAGGCAADDYKHYKARRASGAPGFVPSVVTLTDSFETKDTVLRKQESFATPVDVDGDGISLSPAHLECYLIADEKQVPAQEKFRGRIVESTNRFGVRRLRISKPRSVCVPASQDELTEPGPLPDYGLNAYKCYKAKRDRGEPKLSLGDLSLADQLETKVVRAIKTDLFCNPVDIDGAGIARPDDSLHCYKIKDQSGQPSFGGAEMFVENVFGQETLSLRQAARVCISSAAVVQGRR